ncbi:MAG: sigma-70 family RNA polymerase sigma factor [Phaeodactylibacter sp.]|uniref:RNA polymerase sigma factor n=1 Tax=Phaeodactylibacter sp. TaxID=1940289 RepID=UPI0032F02020
MSRFFRSKYGQLKDEELIDLYLNKGDEHALNHLIKRYYKQAYYFALSILKNPMDAEDATMDIWGKLKANLSKYPIENFRSWLMKVIKTSCLRVLKQRLKNRTDDLDEKNEPSFVEFPPFDALDDKASNLEQLSKAVDGLKDAQNRCIVAFFYQGMSYQEIADEEGFSLKEVKTHIQNGKRNLRLQLTK